MKFRIESRFAFGLALVTATGCNGDGGQEPPPPPPPPVSGGLALETIGNFSFPVYLTSPPGDADRVFVVEKRGTIRVVRQGAILTTPFLDLSGRVSTGTEQGLLGLAFHPEYAANGFFVVNYTNAQGDTRISRFRVSAANADLADPASELVLLPIPQPFANHNGGMVAFGPSDDLLYLGLGDGGSAGDPQRNGQNRNALLGKILRVSLSTGGQLSIPPGNPFVGQAGARGEVWSYGLRNPWRFSFDRATGDLYIGDVGQNAREEIDVATAAEQFGWGANFGWNLMEGRACYPPGTNCDQQGLTLPVLDYGRSDGCSVTGGYVYRGSIASVRGTYFYGDYCGGWVRSFRFLNGMVTEPREWTSLAPGGQITSFGEDNAGELYVMTSGGRVAKIVAQP